MAATLCLCLLHLHLTCLFARLGSKGERRGEPTSSVRSAWPKKEDQVTIVVVGGGDVGLTHTHIHIPEEEKEEEKTRRGELLCLLPFQPVHILVETEEEEEEERLLPLKSPELIGWHRDEKTAGEKSLE